MKKLIFLVYALFTNIIYPVFQLHAQATTYSVPIMLSISNEGLNRTIAVQWSNPSFIKDWTGSADELDYELHLDKQPIITLSTNLIKIRLGFWVKIYSRATNSYIFTHKDYTVSTTLILPPITINTESIKGQYVDLHTDITNALSEVDSRVRNIIEQKLAVIEWIIYKGKIINISSPSPLNKVSNTLTWDIARTYSNTVTPDRVLEITVTSTITASP